MKKDSLKENYGRFKNLPKDELKEIQRRGGINSGKARRERASLKKSFENYLASHPTESETVTVADLVEDTETLTYADLIALKSIKSLISGKHIDPRLLEVIRDTIGEKPAATVKGDLDVGTKAEVVVTLPDNGRKDYDWPFGAD